MTPLLDAVVLEPDHAARHERLVAGTPRRVKVTTDVRIGVKPPTAASAPKRGASPRVGPPRVRRSVTAAGWPAPTGRGVPTLLGDLARRMPRLSSRMTAAHGALFLRTHGRVLSRWFGNPILVLETIGRRSGKLRTTPLVYLPYRNDFAVVPANGGTDRPPAWWLNLQAAGEGFAVLGRERQRITPTIASGIGHERLWHHFCAIAPVEHYQRRTHRTLPIVILTRAGASTPMRRHARAALPTKQLAGRPGPGAGRL